VEINSIRCSKLRTITRDDYGSLLLVSDKCSSPAIARHGCGSSLTNDCRRCRP